MRWRQESVVGPRGQAKLGLPNGSSALLFSPDLGELVPNVALLHVLVLVPERDAQPNRQLAHTELRVTVHDEDPALAVFFDLPELWRNLDAGLACEWFMVVLSTLHHDVPLVIV